MVEDTNDFLFAEEEEEKLTSAKNAKDNKWKILIVDDEEEVHKVTALALKGFSYDGKKLELISKYSGKDAMEAIKDNPDTALILLDVVMEHDHAGLEVVKHIRETIKNKLVRIILRTGQPGQAPEEKVIVEYDINDYKSKQDITIEKLFTTLISSLRSYNDLIKLDQLNKELFESEERFRLLSSQANDAIIMMDNNGNVSFWNNAAERIFGYTEDEIIGKNLHNLLAPQKYHNIIMPALEHFKSTGTGAAIGSHIDITALTKDGEEFPIELSLSSVQIKGQWHSIGIVKDTIERTLYEAQLNRNNIKLKQVKEELKAVLSGSHDKITCVSSDFSIIWTNADTLLHIQPQCYQLLGNNDTKCEICPAALCFKSGKEEETKITTTEGISYNIKAVPIKDNNGNVLRVIEIAQEV
ncbi:MAG: PAS domain S-box protein [Nitrospirae bacterium]|nr:PAS domain S-box protein [Nitrospirota bacterium]